MQIFAEVRLCGSSLQSGERVGEWETRFCVYPMENGEQPYEETRSAHPARERGEFCAATRPHPRPARRRYSRARNLTRYSPSPAASYCSMSGGPRRLRRTAGSRCTLNIQAADLEKHLAQIPKDRPLILVSNHAHRAGIAADLLDSKGFKIAGAIGAQVYESEGGTLVKYAPEKPAANAEK